MIYLGSNQITKIYLGGSDLAAAYLAETKVYPEGAHDYSQDYFTTVALSAGTIDFSGYSATNLLSYSKDEGSTWTEMTSQSESVPVNEGDRVMWKGTPTVFGRTQGMGKFMATAEFNAEGNIMSLLYGDNFLSQTDLTGKDYAFRALFVRNTNLISAENLSLPATTLCTRCYNELFFGCRSLTNAPELPATTLTDYCYASMFYDCPSLTTAPELPATTLGSYCYSQMFRYCTNLTTAPSVLPATTLASWCYQTMFNGCTSLTTAPSLPATTLAEGCYDSMFEGCTSLTTAPELSATTLAQSCYYQMFQGCTSLTTAPSVLPATTLDSNCCQGMFSNCSSLTTGPQLPATTLAQMCYTDMFNGCTSLTTAPELPATTLAESCYYGMFWGCTGLTTAPALPATVLPNSSCYRMFYGCTSLTEIQSLNLSNVHQNACNEMFAGCTSLERITLPSVYSYYSTSVPNTGACRNMFSGCSSLRYVNADENYDANIVVTASQDGCREMFRGSGLRSLHVVARSQAPRGLQGMFNECHSLTNVYVDVTLDNNANQGAIWMFTDSSMQTLSGKITMSSVFSGATYMMQRCTSLTDASNFEIDIQGRVKMQNCDSMFDHCSSLRNLPHFSTATTEIGDYSCQYMFANCTSLTSAKDLYVPSGYLGTGACQYMFKNCTSLTDSPVLSAATVGNSSYYQMFYNCSNLSEITCLATNISAAHSTETWTTNVAPSGTFYKAAEMENWQIDSVNGIPQGWTVKNYGEKDYSQEYFTTVALADGIIRFAGSSYQNTLSYSKDEGQTWTQMSYYQENIPVNEGDRVLWKGTPTIIANSGIGTFADKYAATNTVAFNVEGNIMSLLYGDNFQGQTDLTGKNYAFESLFSGNTHIVSAENLILPVTTLSNHCYASMFNGCTSLTTPPKLPATTLDVGCYKNMFQGCTNLTTAPSVLPATTLAEGCYDSMFDGCTSLTTAPELPATTLASYCYTNMFYVCTSLTEAPELPATTLADYCYGGMFDGCTNLNSVTCLATDISASQCTSYWLRGVASSGTFTKAATMNDWTTGTSGIPDGWTVVDE